MRRSGVFASCHGWRSVWLTAGLGVVLLALAGPSIGQSPPEPKKGAGATDPVASLPQEVRDALLRASRIYMQPLKNARWSKIAELTRTDHTLYQLQGTNERGNKVEMEVTSAGPIVEVEEQGIPLGEVPGAVLAALKDKMPHFKPAKVEAIYQAEKAQPTSYGFEGKDADGKEIEIYISADGKSILN